MRRFAGHVVLVVAAFASIATSKPRWYVTAHAPPTQIDEASGSLAVIEASRPPEDVRCVGANEGTEPANRSTAVGTHYELVCRPGLHFRDAMITGPRSGGCRSKDEPPEGEFIRFAEVRPLKMWRADASAGIDIVVEDLGGGIIYGSVQVLVDGATVSAMTATLATLDATLPAPEVVPWGDNHFEIRLSMKDTKPRRVSVVLHAFGYGICDGACTPGEIRVERMK